MAITELQREKRLQSLGASDIPTVLGLNKHQSSYDLWLLKTGQVERTEMTQAARIGLAMEPTIAALCEEDLGVKLVKPTGTFAASNGVMTANVDRMIEKAQRGSPIVEIKTSQVVDDWENGIPDHVLVQIAAQFICTSSDSAHVAVMLSKWGFDFKIHPVSMDDAGMIDVCRHVEDRACDWWEQHIIRGNEPIITPDSTPSMDFLKIRKRVEGKTVPISSLLCKEYEVANRLAKDAEKRADEVKARLIAALGDAEVGDGDRWTAKFTTVNTTRFDAEALKVDYPDLAAKYVKASSYRKLTVKESK